ncbi:MAG: type II toxin-antitoxin system Phd/YefM family antitoxin [Fusobacteriaceae bacterium]
MVAVSYSHFRNNLKKFCDYAESEGEVVIVTRKNGQGNGVYLPIENYNEMVKELSKYKTKDKK